MNLMLTEVGGTEVWTHTMMKELERRGHNVSVWATQSRPFSYKFDKNLIDQRPADIYDLAIINHLPCYEAARHLSCPKIYTSHSAQEVVEMYEAYPDDDSVIKVAATRQIQRERGGHYIPNPIDLKTFTRKMPTHDEIRTVLYLRKADGSADEIVREACEGFHLIMSSGKDENVSELINRADIVITLGRGILEAIACGRNVVSADRRAWMNKMQGAGYIDAAEHETLEQHRLSGWDDLKTFDAESLRAEVLKYDPQMGERLRAKIEPYDVRKVVDQYLELVDGRVPTAIR